MAATSGYCCNASEPGRGGNARGEGWGERKPVANAWPEPSLISRGAHPALPPGLPPPPGLACPVEGAAVYPAPPLPAWGSVERLYDGRPWNRQQQDRPPAYAISDSSGRIYEETVWHEHQQNCCFIDIPCGARGIPTTNFPEKMYGGTAKNRRLQNGRTSYAAPNPQDRTNRARSPRRCQNGSVSLGVGSGAGCFHRTGYRGIINMSKHSVFHSSFHVVRLVERSDFVSLAPTTHDRLPRRGTERRFENGARTDMSHRNNRNERRGQDCRLQNGYRSASEAIFEGRPRQRHHRDGLPALRDVEAPGTYGYGGAMYPAARLCIGERDAPSDCTAVSCPPGALLDPTFAPPMCGVRRSRLPCDQYLPRFPPYSDFRAAAALTAAAVTLNGSGYLCPGAQPFGKGNARNGPTQPPNRSLNSPQVLKPAEGVPVVIRNEDGTICRCIRAEKWKQPGGLPRKRASTADDLDLHVSFSERDESRLETQIQELVRRLTPDDGWHAIRSFFLAKLRNVLTRSEHTDIEVFMFGSTVSGLATADSDADVYVRTGRGSMTVHNIAALLQRGGMEQIIVIDAAKVQIVKFQDTEFGIKCDINVDGKLALVNTRLVKSYVAIDWRVRAFIITVKHWAKRRGLNAAAEKTLSSYAWSCLCINHLQTRNPPVLPSLHVLAQKRRANATLSPCTDTSAVSTDLDCRPRSPSPVSTASELDEGEEKEAEDFLSDLGDPELVGFRGKNTESVAGLLCSFFRTMAYEFDYHNTVVSVRHGTQIPKTEKGWNVGGCNVGRGRPYRVLAIEDPINIRRNLANSADETAVAGLRCEFRRAWKVLCQTGSLAEVCDPWRSQTTEPRVQEHASWLARFSQEEVLADVEDFRRTQPAPRSVSSLSDRSTCSTGSESRRTSICEEPTPPTSAACSSPATYHRPEKAVAEEEINRPVQGISAIDPTPPPVKIASQKAAESQIAVAGEVGVSQPVGHVTQTPGPVGETHSTGFVAEERAEAANSCHRSLNATTLAPGLPVTRTTNDCGKSRSCNAERRPNGQPSPLAQVYEHEWPTLAEAGTRSRRNRRCPRMASSPPAKPAPSNVTSCDAVPSSQSIIPAAPGGTSVDAPKKALLGIGRGMPFPQVKNTLAPQSASRIPRQQHLRGPAPAASAETAKQERLSTTRCPSPAWAKLPIVAPAPSGHNASEWPTLAASRGGGKSKRRS